MHDNHRYFISPWALVITLFALIDGIAFKLRQSYGLDVALAGLIPVTLLLLGAVRIAVEFRFSLTPSLQSFLSAITHVELGAYWLWLLHWYRTPDPVYQCLVSIITCAIVLYLYHSLHRAWCIFRTKRLTIGSGIWLRPLTDTYGTRWIGTLILE